MQRLRMQNHARIRHGYVLTDLVCFVRRTARIISRDPTNHGPATIPRHLRKRRISANMLADYPLLLRRFGVQILAGHDAPQESLQNVLLKPLGKAHACTLKHFSRSPIPKIPHLSEATDSTRVSVHHDCAEAGSAGGVVAPFLFDTLWVD